MQEYDDDDGDGDDAEHDSEKGSGEEAIYGEDTDFLGDFPDDTEASLLAASRALHVQVSERVVSKQELDLVHGRITSLEHLRLHRFANHLKKLCLRQNYVAHLDPGLFSLLTRLEELDLYDNKIKTPGDALNCLSKLTQVVRMAIVIGLMMADQPHTVYWTCRSICFAMSPTRWGISYRSRQFTLSRIEYPKFLVSSPSSR